MKRSQIFSIALSLMMMPIAAKAQLPVKKLLTLDAAKKIVTVAEAEAKKRGATVVIAVVDDGGYLLVLERLDDTQVASVDGGNCQGAHGGNLSPAQQRIRGPKAGKPYDKSPVC